MTTWETIAECANDRLDRIEVPGGWLYRQTYWSGDDSMVALAFVARPPLVFGINPDQLLRDPQPVGTQATLFAGGIDPGR